MWDFFAYDYHGEPFVQLGSAHIAMLLVILGAIAAFWRLKSASGFSSTRLEQFRLGLAALLLINELGWHAWHAVNGLWSVQEMLPLEICNLMVFGSAWALVSKRQRVFEFIYLLGVPAASQVLITPALGPYGFPHILFFQIFISHGGIVLAAFYLILLEGMHPSGWQAVRRVAGWTLLYAGMIFFLNLALGSNYLFLANKPPAATMLDLLGPWPWYILSMIVLGAALISLMYLPFDLLRRISRRKAHKNSLRT